LIVSCCSIQIQPTDTRPPGDLRINQSPPHSQPLESQPTLYLTTSLRRRRTCSMTSAASSQSLNPPLESQSYEHVLWELGPWDHYSAFGMGSLSAWYCLNTHSRPFFSWLVVKTRFLYPRRPSPARRIKSSKPRPCTQPPAATATTTTNSPPLVPTVPSSTRYYRITISRPGSPHRPARSGNSFRCGRSTRRQ
jgi:hypothetical protein